MSANIPLTSDNYTITPIRFTPQDVLNNIQTTALFVMMPIHPHADPILMQATWYEGTTDQESILKVSPHHTIMGTTYYSANTMYAQPMVKVYDHYDRYDGTIIHQHATMPIPQDAHTAWADIHTRWTAQEDHNNQYDITPLIQAVQHILHTQHPTWSADPCYLHNNHLYKTYKAATRSIQIAWGDRGENDTLDVHGLNTLDIYTRIIPYTTDSIRERIIDDIRLSDDDYPSLDVEQYDLHAFSNMIIYIPPYPHHTGHQTVTSLRHCAPIMEKISITPPRYIRNP